jgi:hypothetical protein
MALGCGLKFFEDGSKAAAILWELAPGSGGHFAGFLQGFQGFLQILQFPSQVLRPQLLTGCLPLGKITKNIFFSFS